LAAKLLLGIAEGAMEYRKLSEDQKGQKVDFYGPTPENKRLGQSTERPRSGTVERLPTSTQSPPLSRTEIAILSELGKIQAKQDEIRTTISGLQGRRNGKQSRLTAREKKIWEVIQRRSRGMQYCRELASAGVKPRRKWIEQEMCPSTYTGAYQNPLWRQRINDEKTKIRRKATGA
jgi:hypothetical protein